VCSSDLPGTLTCTNSTLKMLLVKAYDLKNYQVEGPDWLDSAGFDIVAKVPAGTSKEQFNLMLQGLLAERFKVAVHRETKTLAAYVLTVAKGGPKLKEVDQSTLDASAAATAANGGMPLPPPPPRPSSGGLYSPAGGMPKMPKSAGLRMAMMATPTSMFRALSGYATMKQLTAALSGALDRPVVDETALTATYDLELTWVPDGNDNLLTRMGPMPAAMIGGSVAGSAADSGRGPAPADASEPGMNLPQALQAKLGLHLEQKKAPVEILIVDRAEKTPIEN
jgi:uncharacterized protein (TIGR03435 family)